MPRVVAARATLSALPPRTTDRTSGRWISPGTRRSTAATLSTAALRQTQTSRRGQASGPGVASSAIPGVIVSGSWEQTTCARRGLRLGKRRLRRRATDPKGRKRAGGDAQGQAVPDRTSGEEPGDEAGIE